MDEELTPFGEVKPWLVAGFPVKLREEINRAARISGATVSEWLVEHFKQHGIGGMAISEAKISQAQPPLALPAPDRQGADPKVLMDMMVALSNIGGLQPETILAINRMLVREARGYSAAKLKVVKAVDSL